MSRSHLIRRRLLALGSSVLAFVAGAFGTSRHENGTEGYRSVQPARHREEEGEHDHTENPGEASYLPPVEESQLPAVALEEDGFLMPPMPRQPSRALPYFSDEEFVPLPERENESRR